MFVFSGKDVDEPWVLLRITNVYATLFNCIERPDKGTKKTNASARASKRHVE